MPGRMNEQFVTKCKAAHSGRHHQNAFSAERPPSLFVQVEILNGGQVFGAVAAFGFVLKKSRVQRAVGFPYFAVLFLESETGSTGAKGNPEADNLPGLRLALTPSKKLVLAADGPCEGKDFGAGEWLFHILFVFDSTNIIENNCQMQIFSKLFVKTSFGKPALVIFVA